MFSINGSVDMQVIRDSKKLFVQVRKVRNEFYDTDAVVLISPPRALVWIIRKFSRGI